MVKMENAITVDVKAIVIRNYIKLGEHVKKIEMKIFMASSTRLRYFAASTQGKHGSTRLKTFYGSAFAASAATPRSTTYTLRQ